MTNKTLVSWLPLAVGGTVILLVGYVTLQQTHRQQANDPKIMLAEDAAAALDSGYPANALFESSSKTDMSVSQSPFGMVFDASGKLLGASAYNGDSSLTLPPSGIFDYARMHGEDRVTWQTPSGLRFAAIVLPWKVSATASSSPGLASSGYVLVARSLRDTEIRVRQLGWITFFGWLGFLFLTFILKMGAAHVTDPARTLDDKA